MRIALDPVPLVLGIYAYVGKLLTRAVEQHEEDDAASLGKRFGGRREHDADREIRRLVRTLQTDIKTADKLLRKSADIWKISEETDLVDLIVQSRGDGAGPESYVLLRPDDVRALLGSIREAALGAGEDRETIDQLDDAAENLQARPSEYLAFGFDPWGA